MHTTDMHPITHQSDRLPDARRAGSGGEFIALGVLSLVAGALAIIFPVTTTLAVELVFGGALIVTGIGQLACAWRVRSWRGTAGMTLIGLLGVAAGVAMLLFPLAGILTLTTLLAAMFLSSGTIRTALAVRLRPRDGWGALLISGLFALAAGLLIVLALPEISMTLLGIMLGVDLLLTGLWTLTGRIDGTR